MKRTLYFLCAAGLLATVLCGCQGSVADTPVESVPATDGYYNTVENAEGTFTVVEEQTDNYTVWSSREHAGNLYKIYDNSGNLLDKGYHGWRGGFDITQDGNVIVLEYGFGGTNVSPAYRFYHTETGEVSRYIEGPVAHNGELIAYAEYDDTGTRITVENVFDPASFRKQLYPKKAMKMPEFIFTDDGKIAVRYMEDGNESNTIEETFTYETLTERLTREIHGAYQQACKAPENSSTAAMSSLAYEYTEKWEQAADACYRAILTYDEPDPPSDGYYSAEDLHGFITDMKQNREPYSQAQIAAYLKVLQANYQGGTITGPIIANYTYDMQMEWALELAGICDMLGIDPDT